MANNIYIGNRYVPIFANPVEWDNLREYEALTIVTYQGTAYTSRKTVPVGTALSNTEYWVVTGNYNAQVEMYRRELDKIKGAYYVLSGIGGICDGSTDNTGVFNTFISEIGNKQCTLIVDPGTFKIGGGVVIPSNITLQFTGGTILINNGANLTINSEIIAPLYKIFEVEGNLSINKKKNTTGYPEWFDDNVNLALKYFKCVELQAKDYIVNEDIIINDDNITLRGVSFSTFYGTEGGSRIVLEGGCEIIVGEQNSRTIGDFPRNITLENFEISQTDHSYDEALAVFGVVYGRFKNLTISVGWGNRFGVYCTKNVSTIYESCRVQATDNPTSFDGFYLTDRGNPILAGGNASIYFNNCTVNSTGDETGTSRGWHLIGACSDTFLNGCETAGTSFGFVIEGTSVVNGANDILINNCVFDGCSTHCIYIRDITVDGAISISNTYMAKDRTNHITNSCLFLENCKASVALSNVQMLSVNSSNIGLQISGDTTLIGNGIIANGMNTPFVNSGSTNNVYCQYMHNGTLTTVSP